jgi:alkaline phosphatase D
MTRRRLLLGAAAAGAFAPVFLRHARAADVQRFSIGVASGQPHAQGMVLWTRLMGAGLPDEVDVSWELAEDEAFTRIAARGTEKAHVHDAHSVHAEPAGLKSARRYWYRFSALGQRSAVGRTATAPAADAAVAKLDFVVASCQRYDMGHYAAWTHAAREDLDLICFLGDYIYEYKTARGAVRDHIGGPVVLLDDYRSRYAQYKGDPALQAAHAACPWLVVWDDHEVDNDYAGLQGQGLQPAFAAQREAAYRAYWEHMPLPKAARPTDGSMRIYGSLDWGRLARVHLLDDRQYRDPQACPPQGRGGSATVDASTCAALLDPRRTLLGARQEQWLAGNWSLDRPWNLLAQQTLMTRLDWAGREAGSRYWTDGWDGYPAARQRLLSTVAERKVPGVVVLGGDVHANFVADLKLDFDDPRSPVIATEFCGTSISSRGMPQSRVDTALQFNPHIHHGRSDQRGYGHFTLKPGEMQAVLQVVAEARDPVSVLSTQARFSVAAERPGARRS